MSSAETGRPSCYWEIFFELYEALPRQGPGNSASAARALALCGPLASAPRTLPPAAWWDDFYTPMEARIVELRAKYAGQPEPETTLNLLQREVDLHRRYGDWYGYEFFIVRPG